MMNQHDHENAQQPPTAAPIRAAQGGSIEREPLVASDPHAVCRQHATTAGVWLEPCVIEL